MHLPPVVRLDQWVDRWAVASQQRSCRNAMVAATVLTQRRAESREVEDFLAARGVRRAADQQPELALSQ
ncbi:hypothetical protein [Nocardioides sp. GXQ0305]|uniref:hypothetical protein n=1 Tax=Nocardioides sp. GXQ0305 TaxID=3423912 RepID=UPI003D7D89D3